MNNIRLYFNLVFLCIINICCSQDYFEGVIEYRISYESLNENIPVAFFETELGAAVTAYIKEDRYAMVHQGTGEMGWSKTIVRLDQGFTYTEYEKSDTITKSKFGDEQEILLEFKRNTNDFKTVLNLPCESITLNIKSKDEDALFDEYLGKYYFHPKYKLNPEYYKNYTDEYWNLYVEEARAVSLRNEMVAKPYFKAVQEAVEITEEKVTDRLFEPNEDKVIVLEE
jgi:hypothetical protein